MGECLESGVTVEVHIGKTEDRWKGGMNLSCELLHVKARARNGSSQCRSVQSHFGRGCARCHREMEMEGTTDGTGVLACQLYTTSTSRHHLSHLPFFSISLAYMSPSQPWYPSTSVDRLSFSCFE
jgi:hypothetical protein